MLRVEFSCKRCEPDEHGDDYYEVLQALSTGIVGAERPNGDVN